MTTEIASLLFPWFLRVACLSGAHGTIVFDQIGPIDDRKAAEVMRMYATYEAGCEVGVIERGWRWRNAIPAEPIHPRHWLNIKVNDMDLDTFVREIKLNWKDEAT